MATDSELPVPDFTRSYIRVPRAVLRALRGTTLIVYLELLDRAAFQAGPRRIGGHVVTLEIGQCVVGRNELAASCLASESTIRTSLNRLQTLQLIAIQSTSRGSVITVRGLLESKLGNPAESPAESPADQPAGSPALRQPIASGSTTNGDLRSENRDPRQGVGEPARAPARSQGPQPAPPPAPAPDPAPTPTGLPDGWSPDPEANREAEAKARARGVDVDQQLDSLRNQAPAKGMTSCDWNATWRYWLSIAHPAKHQTGNGKRDDDARAYNTRYPILDDGKRDEDERTRIRKIPTLAGSASSRVRVHVPETDPDGNPIPEPAATTDDRLAWAAAVRDGLAYKPTPTPPADAPADAGPDGEP